MVDFLTDEAKQIEEKYNALRVLLADIGSGNKPMRAVRPELMVSSTGSEGAPEVTAALIVATAAGGDTLEALTNLEAALRIAAYGEQADVALESPQLVDVSVAPMDDECTLADVVSANDCTGRTLN